MLASAPEIKSGAGKYTAYTAEALSSCECMSMKCAYSIAMQISSIPA